MGPQVEAAFVTADRSWTDRAELVSLLAGVLRRARPRVDGKTRRGIAAQRYRTRPAGGPGRRMPDERRPDDLDNSNLTSSLVPEGLFEYQHAMGDTLDEAFRKGFKGFAEGDLPVFLDALETKPLNAPSFSIIVRAGVVQAERIRRVVVSALRHGTAFT